MYIGLWSPMSHHTDMSRWSDPICSWFYHVLSGTDVPQQEQNHLRSHFPDVFLKVNTSDTSKRPAGMAKVRVNGNWHNS